MAQRISEQVIEYLTVGGDGFTPQTNVPLTINGTLAMNDNNVSYPGRETWTWPTTWLLNPSNNDFIIAKNNNDGGTFNYARPTFKIDSDAINIGKKLLLQTGQGGGFNLSDGTVSSPTAVGLFYIETLGTSNANGITTIQIGNDRNTGTASNAAGKIKIYSSSSGYGSIVQESTTSNYTHTLPSSSGWIVKAATGGVGNVNTPIYITNSGVATAITGAIANNTTGNATTATRANITSALNSLAYYNSNNGAFASSTSSFIINENSTKGILTTISSGSAGYTLENTNISNSIKGGLVVDNNSNIGIYKNTPSSGRWILKYNAINNKTYIPDWTCGSIINPVYFDSNGSPVAIDPYIYTSQEGGGVVIPFIYNDLAYLHEKGGSYKWYITTSTNFTSTSLDSASGTTMIANNTDDLDILFNGSGDFKDMGQKYNDRMVIDIVCPKTFTWNTLFYIDFHTQDFCATQVGIYVAKDSGTYVDLTNLTFSNSLTNPLPTINNGTLKNGTLSVEKKNSYYMRMITHNDISTGFNKIRIVLTNWIYKNADNNSGDHYHRISGIGLINYSSLGVRETFMSRGMDDPLYRSLTQKHYINDNSRALVINPRNKITYSSGNNERFLLITLPTLSNVTISFEIDIFNNNEHATYYIRGKIPTNTDAGTAWTNCYASSIGSKKIGNCSVYFTRNKSHTGRYQVAIGYHKMIVGSETIPYWIWDSNTEIIIKNVFIHNNSNNDISFLNNFDIISEFDFLAGGTGGGDKMIFSPAYTDNQVYSYLVGNSNGNAWILANTEQILFNTSGNNAYITGSGGASYLIEGSFDIKKTYRLTVKICAGYSSIIEHSTTFNLKNNSTYKVEVLDNTTFSILCKWSPSSGFSIKPDFSLEFGANQYLQIIFSEI